MLTRRTTPGTFPGSRLRALEALGRIGPGAKAAVPALLRALEDRAPQYRVLAARALGGIGPADERVVPVLVRLFAEELTTGMSFAAAEALQKLGPGARAAV